MPPSVADEDLDEAVRDVMASAAKAAQSSDAEEYEAFVQIMATKKVAVDPESGHDLSLMNERTLFVRTLKNGRMGVSHTNDLRPKRIHECFRNAVRLSAQHQKDKTPVSFASVSSGYPEVEALCDRRIAELDLSDACDMVDEMLAAVLDSDKDIQVTGGRLWSNHSMLGIRNSNGIDVGHESTSIEASCASVCGRGQSVSPECISMAFSSRNDLQMEEIGRKCAFIAARSCVQVPAETGEFQVVFSPRSLGSADSGLVTLMMSRALSGMDVLNGSSVLGDKLGQKVASETLSMRDAPTLPGKYGSRPFDDEGVPTSNKWLIKKGVLKSFTWDNRCGSQSGQSSTGNAVRDLGSGLVTPAPLLLEVNRGKGDMHDLISEVDDGYLVWDCQGSHTGSSETGAFSFVASPGLKIENGDIVGGVRGAMLSGNIVELLSSIDRIGADRADFGCSLMPSVLFDGVRITTG
ncbi:TPA: TldD/PmbA family protein [Thermoplasmata archaeon]|nr:TldD/PmbA family protein [Thermoplasmata archaeon]